MVILYKPLENEKDSLEFKLTFNGEVLDSKMVTDGGQKKVMRLVG